MTFYSSSATLGEFHIRGTEEFKQFSAVFTRLANSVDLGFEPQIKPVRAVLVSGYSTCA